MLLNDQSRGKVVDLFLKLRETLVELRAGLGGPVVPIDEPFGDLVDHVLAAGTQLLHGQDVDKDQLFADIKSIGQSIVDGFKAVFNDVASGTMPTTASL